MSVQYEDLCKCYHEVKVYVFMCRCVDCICICMCRCEEVAIYVQRGIVPH